MVEIAPVPETLLWLSSQLEPGDLGFQEAISRGNKRRSNALTWR
jgi:hypothetical protein